MSYAFSFIIAQRHATSYGSSISAWWPKSRYLEGFQHQHLESSSYQKHTTTERQVLYTSFKITHLVFIVKKLFINNPYDCSMSCGLFAVKNMEKFTGNNLDGAYTAVRCPHLI